MIRFDLIQTLTRTARAAALAGALTGCGGAAELTEQAASKLEADCQVVALDIRAPDHMVAGRSEYATVRGLTHGACDIVDVRLEGDGEAILETQATPDEDGDFSVVVELDPVETLSAEARAGESVMQESHAIAVHDEDTVRPANIEIAEVISEGTARRVRVNAESDRALNGALVCMSPCVGDENLQLAAAGQPLEALEGSAQLEVELPACAHASVVVCKVVEEGRPGGYNAGSAPAAKGVDGDEAPIDQDTAAMAEAWLEQEAAYLYPFAQAASYMTMASRLDDDSELRVNLRPYVNPDHTGAAETGRLVLKARPGMKLTFDILPDEQPPTAPAAPNETPDMPGVPDIGGLTDPMGHDWNESTPSPFETPDMPTDPSALTPNQRLNVVLGAGWTNFVKSLSQPAGGAMPASSNSPVHAGGIIGNIITGVKAAGAALAGTIAGGAAAVSGAVAGVAYGLYQAVNGKAWGCHNLAGDSAKSCEEKTDKIKDEYDPKTDGSPQSFCSEVYSGSNKVNEREECKTKLAKKKKAFCKDNPNDSSCKKDNNNNSSSNYCTPDDPNCQDTPGFNPNGLKGSEKPQLRISLGLCSATQSKTTEDAECPKKVDMDMVAKQAIATVCKKQSEIGYRCEPMKTAQPRPVIRGDVDPVDPE